MASTASDGRVRAAPRASPHQVAITGATGYMGRALTDQLVARGHSVRALIRPGTDSRVASGATAVALDLFNADELSRGLQGCDTVVHLIGTAHPSPRKAKQFLSVDLASARACATAAARSDVAHFVYVSVAQPAPVMKAYVTARAAAERALLDAQLTSTVLRPWYVLGPGHRWPMLLIPLYACAELFPTTRSGARRLGFVTLGQMTDALTHAVEHPPETGAQRILEVPQIRLVSAGLR